MTLNPKSGKKERVYVNLEAVYGNHGIAEEEVSFEELRALHRGWLQKDWRRRPVAPKALRETAGNARVQPRPTTTDAEIASLAEDLQKKATVDENSEASQQTVEDENLTQSQDTTVSINTKEGTAEIKPAKARKMKVREIKQEPRTGMSPCDLSFLFRK